MAGVNISLECFGIAVSLFLLLCSIQERCVGDHHTGIVRAMLSTNILVLLCDMLTWVWDEPQFETILYLLNFLVYSLGYVLTALFAWYLVTYISERTKISKHIVYVITLLCIVAVILVAISLFNHMYFSFDGGIYIRGPLYWVSQIYPIGIMSFEMGIILYYREQLGIHDTISLLSYGVLPIIAMLIQIFIFGITLLYISTTLSLLIIYITIHVEQGKRLQKKETELTQANISIMLSQIQPHFLFNALTAISQLCDINPRKAKKATIEFSQYLRGNLDSLRQKEPLPFETELRHIRTYLFLEKMRFNEELNIIYDIKTTAFLIPSLTIQPIVENAVKYGVGEKKGAGTITLSTYEEKERFVISIVDDGIGYDPNEAKRDGRSHIGLSNAKERLKAMCGGTLEVHSEKGIGTTVIVKIPKSNASR